MRLNATSPAAAAAAAIIALALVVLFTGIATREVHGTAALYASLARSIADSGDPFGVFTGPDAYLLKPPLMLWLTALSVKLFGPTSLAATLITRLSGLVLVLLTWWLARRLYGPVAAWCAALVLLTNGTFHQFATALRMDALLMVGVMLSVIAYLHGERRWAPALFFTGLSVAILAKGPPGLLPLALLPLHWLIARPALAGPRWWLAGALVLALPIAWYGFLIDANGARVWEELGADIQRGQRITPAEQLRSAVSTYLLTPLTRFWPGLPFMLAGMVMAAAGLRRAPAQVRASAALMLGWVLLVVVASSIKPDHDIRYLFLALPALAVLGGLAAARLLRERIPVWLVLLVSTLALLLAVVGPRLERDDRAEVAQIRARLDAALPAGAPVAVVSAMPNNRPGPRRQHTEVDWVHYYLGRPARMHVLQRTSPADLAGEPLVLVARYVRSPAVLSRLALAPLVQAEEMTLARPRAIAPIDSVN